MTDNTTVAQTVILEDDFVIELMRGLHRQGFAGLRPPELDRLANASDIAAVQTYRYMEQQYADVKLRFYLTYDIEPTEDHQFTPECRQWQRRLHELGSLLFKVDTFNGLLRFDASGYPYDDTWAPPGDQTMWDDLCVYFAERAASVLRIPQELQ